MTEAEILLDLMESGFNATYDEVVKALQKVSYDDIYNELAGVWSIELWDGTTPVNGADPERVRKSHGMAEGDKALLLRKNGAVVIFQPKDPETQEKITEQNYQAVGEKMLHNMLDPDVKQKFLRAIKLQIIQNRVIAQQNTDGQQEGQQ